MTFVTERERWEAVVARERGADGAFFYGVSTTGVVCRPSCGARRPLRANVRFFDELDAALVAGFRPCKRCRPDGASHEERRAALVTAACRAIEASDAPLSLATLAARAGVSPHHLQRVFVAATGVSPRGYAARVRQARVEAALAQGVSVTTALHDAGYSSSGRFYADAPARHAMPPARARRGGEGERVAYAIAPCSLGVALVAATARGPCAILLGDDDDAVERELTARFPKAALCAGGQAATKVLARVIALVERPQDGLELPLDVRGTAFQRRVWEALRALPPGQTITYTALAARVGAPSGARAVAAACASNPLAVAIPCHRVVRSDGALAGYRWGVERKRALLGRERKT